MGELFAACISDNNNNIITILVMISVMQIHAGMYANVHAHIVRMAVHIANNNIIIITGRTVIRENFVVKIFIVQH